MTSPPPPDMIIRPPDVPAGDRVTCIARATAPTGRTADIYLVHPASPGETIWHGAVPWLVTSVRDAEQEESTQ